MKEIGRMERIKNFLRTNPVTKPVYLSTGRKFYEVYYRVKKYKMAKAMHRSSSKTIAQLQRDFEELEMLFFFDMGTLLGIIREGKLMTYDYDIDLGVKVRDNHEKRFVREKLVGAGYKLILEDIVDEIGTVEESYEKNGVKIDINYYVTEMGKDICYLLYKDPESASKRLNVVKLDCDEITATKKVDFGGLMVSVPAEAEIYLSQRYGETWRIPDKGYVYWKGPSASKIENLGDQIRC